MQNNTTANQGTDALKQSLQNLQRTNEHILEALNVLSSDAEKRDKQEAREAARAFKQREANAAQKKKDDDEHAKTLQGQIDKLVKRKGEKSVDNGVTKLGQEIARSSKISALQTTKGFNNLTLKLVPSIANQLKASFQDQAKVFQDMNFAAKNADGKGNPIAYLDQILKLFIEQRIESKKNFKRDAISEKQQKLKDFREKSLSNIATGIKKVVKPIVAVAKVAGNWLKKLAKFIAALAIISNPEAIAKAIKDIANAVVSLSEKLNSEEFKKGLGAFVDIIGKIASFSVDRITQLLDGISGISDAFNKMLEGDWASINWGDFVGDIGNVAVGFTGLAIVLAPFATAGVAFTALKALPGLIAGLGTALTGLLSLPVFAALTAIEGLAPSSAADGTLDAQRDSQGRLPGDPGYTTSEQDKQRREAGESFWRNLTNFQMNPRGFNRGSLVPGSGNGDTVPAMLEPGEYVLNKKLVAAMGAGNLNAMNYGMVPRFQTGGIVPLGKDLVDAGYSAWQHPDFNVDSGYTGSGNERTMMRSYDSHHNHGEALDFPLSHNTAAELDKLYAYLLKNKDKLGITELLWKSPGHHDHLHVAVGHGQSGNVSAYDAPKAGLTPSTETATSSISAIASQFMGPFAQMFDVLKPLGLGIGNAMSSLLGIGSAMASTSTSNIGAGSKKRMGELIALAKGAGFNDSEAQKMAAIAMAESGGNAGIDTVQSGLDPSKSNEYSIGLWQINWKAHQSMLRAMGISENDLRNPEINARVAKRIYDMQGLNAWGAYSNGSYRQFLGAGMQSGLGGPVSKGLLPGAGSGMLPTNLSVQGSLSSRAFNGASTSARVNGLHDSGSAPIIVSVPSAPASSGGTSAASDTSKPPVLPAHASTAVAMDYLYRAQLGAMLS